MELPFLKVTHAHPFRMTAGHHVCPTQSETGIVSNVALPDRNEHRVAVFPFAVGNDLRKLPFTDAEGGIISKKVKAFAWILAGNWRIVNETSGLPKYNNETGGLLDTFVKVASSA